MKQILVWIVIAVGIAMMYIYPHVMLNPGELTEGHQPLNNQCMACHRPFWGIANEKCISCHKLSEIGIDSLRQSNGDTAREKILFHEQLSTEKCTSCHSDHQGIQPGWAISRFQHELLSESRISNCNGCHRKPTDAIHGQISANCKSCHNTQGWKSAVVFNHDMIEGTDKNDCVLCHNKPSDNLHQQLSATCNQCHNTEGWKSSVRFNHSMILNAAINNCTACHQKPDDSYHSLFAAQCGTCHTTSSWIPSTFDHSRYFKLEDEHKAECNSCHTNNNLSNYTCYGCHEHSESKIIQEHREEGISNITHCATCHRSGDEHDIRLNGKTDRKQDEQDVNTVKDNKKKGREHRHDDD